MGLCTECGGFVKGGYAVCYKCNQKKKEGGFERDGSSIQHKPIYVPKSLSDREYASYLATHYGEGAKDIFLTEINERKNSSNLSEYLNRWRRRSPVAGGMLKSILGGDEWMND